MALEGPFLAAVIARLPDPTFNLAAYGVAFAFAILIESPVIMLMSASTALVSGAESYRRMRNFTWVLNVLCTLLLLVVLIPPVYQGLTHDLLGLPDDVSDLVRGSLWILLPWPAAIGYRRFLHGILIRSGRTRLVAIGTIARLAGMATTALTLAPTDLPGAWVGAAALSGGVVVEAAMTGLLAIPYVRRVNAHRSLARRRNVEDRPTMSRGAPAAADSRSVAAPSLTGIGSDQRKVGISEEKAASQEVEEPAGTEETGAPTYGFIARFYYPLALTSLIGLAAQPLLTFFMGRSPEPVVSLALFPVVHALNFFFSALGLSYQEAAIALLGEKCEHWVPVTRFAVGLGIAASAGLALIAFTPLARLWFEGVSGLTPELAQYAIPPTRVIFPLPALGVAIAVQRAILVQRRTTRPITLATAIEVLGIALVFPLFGWGFGLMGVLAAMIAMVVGRSAGVAFLVTRTLRALGEVTGNR